jgi:hypothetical protein
MYVVVVVVVPPYQANMLCIFLVIEYTINISPNFYTLAQRLNIPELLFCLVSGETCTVHSQSPAEEMRRLVGRAERRVWLAG